MTKSGGNRTIFQRNSFLKLSLLSLLSLTFFLSTTPPPPAAFAEGASGGGSTGSASGGGGGGDDRRTWVLFTFDLGSDGKPTNPTPTIAGVTIDGCAKYEGFYFAYKSTKGGGILNEAYPTQYWRNANWVQNTWQKNCGGNGDGNNNSTPYCKQGMTPDSKYYDSV